MHPQGRNEVEQVEDLAWSDSDDSLVEIASFRHVTIPFAHRNFGEGVLAFGVDLKLGLPSDRPDGSWN